MERRSVKFTGWFLIACLILAAAGPVLASDIPEGKEDGYAFGRFASKLKHKPAGTFTKVMRTLAGLPAFPWNLVGRGLKEFAIFIEHYKLDKKVPYYLRKLHEHGINPAITSYGDEQRGFGGGGEVELTPILTDKFTLDGIDLKFGATASTSHYYHYYGDFRKSDFLMEPLSLDFRVDYIDWSEEEFYGIGPRTSLGETQIYDLEKLNLKGALEFKPKKWLTTSAGVGYSKADVENGSHGGGMLLREVNTVESLPGIHGGEILHVYGSVGISTLDREELPTKGFLINVTASNNQGVDGSPFKYWKYDIEAATYLRVPDEKKVLALRLKSEMTGGGSIPFYEKPMLGGPDSLRSYKAKRFVDDNSILFTGEYRYNIYSVEAFSIDAALIFDLGNVFSEWSEWQAKTLREGYGVGFRLKAWDKLVTNIEISHGDEGTKYYFKKKLSF